MQKCVCVWVNVKAKKAFPLPHSSPGSLHLLLDGCTLWVCATAPTDHSTAHVSVELLRLRKVPEFGDSWSLACSWLLTMCFCPLPRHWFSIWSGIVKHGSIPASLIQLPDNCGQRQTFETLLSDSWLIDSLFFAASKQLDKRLKKGIDTLKWQHGPE